MLGQRSIDAIEARPGRQDLRSLPHHWRRPRTVRQARQEDRASRCAGGRDIFAALSRPGGGRRRRSLAIPVSLGIHAAALALLVLLPILWPSSLPTQRNYVRVLLYDPPPPPPPPLPKGSGLRPDREVSRVAKRLEATVAPVVEPPRLDAPQPFEEPTRPAAASSDDGGSPTGSEFGTPEGMEGGVEGGVVGGVPGGVGGGVLGGTGDIPVHDYDRPPRLLKQTRPRYPQEAFVKKIEGTVVLELLIDAAGRVARARVVQSVPALDAAALEAAREWVFSPALKQGRPVATLATAPVSFRIY